MPVPEPSPAITALLRADRAVGRVERIGTRPAKRAPVVELRDWDLEGGLDHGRARATRTVTLFQAEHALAVAALRGADFDPLRLRRNLVVSGINLVSLLGWDFEVGEVLLRGTLPCDPCQNMEEALGAGACVALFGMGGICAALLRTGTIRVGDPVRRLGPAPAPVPAGSPA